MRVAITGAPSSGKTTLAQHLTEPGQSDSTYSTDDLIDLGWSEASRQASYWFDEEGPILVEGVAVPRALRKWLRRNPTGKPVDSVIVLTGSLVPLNIHQRRMATGLMTVLVEIMPDLERRGVSVEWR